MTNTAVAASLSDMFRIDCSSQFNMELAGVRPMSTVSATCLGKVAEPLPFRLAGIVPRCRIDTLANATVRATAAKPKVHGRGRADASE
jgi:hypothetical protein